MTKTTRAQRSAERRRIFHENRIATADTPSAAIWAACGWLVAEGRRRGAEHLAAAAEAVTGLTQLTTDQLDRVLTTIHDLRQEARR